MQVKEVMTKGVDSAGPGCGVREAARRMMTDRYERLVGVLSIDDFAKRNPGRDVVARCWRPWPRGTYKRPMEVQTKLRVLMALVTIGFLMLSLARSLAR